MSLLAGLNIANGIFGLVSGIRGQRESDKLKSAAQRTAEADAGLAEKMKELAMGYDPTGEVQGAVDQANTNARRQMDLGLRQLNADFARTGGQALDDTRFPALAQNVLSRAWDPVRMWQAEELSRGTEKRLMALRSAYSSDGGQGAMAMAQATRPNLTGPFQLLTSATSDWIEKNQDRMRKNRDAQGVKIDRVRESKLNRVEN